MSVVDLDLIIASYSDGTTAEIQLHRPEQQVASLLAPPTTWPFDPSHLARHILDSVAYGQALSEQLFAAQPLLMAWHEASAYAKGHQARLRLRLILPVNAPELQALRWETLYDPVRHVPLASSDRVWLVRLPSTTSLEMIKPPPRSGLRATVVVANPRNLAGYRLGPIDVDGEIARARRALGSACSIIIGDHEDAIQRQASLSAILTALRQAPHILYLVCHGKTENGETQLCLEGDLGEAIWLRGSMLVEAIENLSPPPLMTMLIACRSAGDGYGDALNVLGPQLARAGIPAVLGFQGDVAQRTVRRCMAILWDEIRKDGRIDRALTIARREIGQDLWWQPVLWLRAADGRLWRDDPSLPLASSIETIEQISKQTGLSPELRDLSAALWFESEQHNPNWPLVEQMALQLLAAIPEDELASRLLSDARQQLMLQARYRTIAQRRTAGVSYTEIALALESLERTWPGFPDPESLQTWVAEERRTARLKPALEQLRERQGAHAALDMIERFLEEHPNDADAAQITAEIAEMVGAPFEQRLRAAQMAGQIGDPRCPTSIAQWRTSVLERSYLFGRPNGYWCYIPSGTYCLGEEASRVEIVLPAFWIARYPVTVAQYREFICDGGYDEERWWGPEGWAARQAGLIGARPWGWDAPRYSQPNQPLIGVSWDEALAFCTWLSQRLRPMLTSYQVHLPSEAMWEVAARYGDDQQPRSYPWGEQEPTIDLAVHMTRPRQLRDDAPGPVGCCVAGAAACGALDMAGNIWELMASSWESYPHTSEPPAAEEYIAWRGGAWALGAAALRATNRDRTRRHGHNYAYGGFRIVITPRV